MEKNNQLEPTQVLLSMPSTDQLGKLSGLKTVYKMNPSYRTQEDWAMLKDKPIRCFYIGLKEIPNDKGEVIKCAIFADKNEVFLCAQFILLEAVKNEELNTAFEIIYKGKKKNKTGEGSTNLFDISKLG